MSRKARPKQFLPLVGANSSFQDTILRVKDLPSFGQALVVTGEPHAGAVLGQLSSLGETARILVEPEGRDSGPAIAAAAVYLLERDPDAVLLVLAADHHIADVETFRRAIEQAVAAAQAGYIVTFGIEPDSPATGYGYIQPGSDVEALPGVRRVRAFVEKPTSALAQQFLAEGYLWNSGNFAFRADTFLGELESFEPQMARAVRAAVDNAKADDGVVCLDADSFRQATKKPVDYAVMERTARAVVVAADIGWSDLGSWSAIWQVLEHDRDGNAAVGDVIAVDTKDTLVHADGVFVATIGLEGIVVVATGDAVLVSRQDASQTVKEVVDRLNKLNRRDLTEAPPPIVGTAGLPADGG